MALRGLAEYLAAKHARNNVFAAEADDNLPTTPDLGISAPITYQEIDGPSDNSLGAHVHASMAQRYKDKLVAVYDRIKEELTQLPFFQQLYKDMANEPILLAFNSIIDAYTTNIATAPDLKSAFLFGVKYVASFNDLRDKLPSLIKDREKMHRIDEAIYSTQLYMWAKLKAMLDVHKIGSNIIPLDAKEAEDMKKVLSQLPQGTWHYGPLKNPTKSMFRKNKSETSNRLKNRLEDENLRDEIAARLGPYASPEEIQLEFEKAKSSDKKQRADLAKQKYNQSLFGKEKNKHK